MGRTVPAYRPALEEEIKSWEFFKRGLKPKERDVFEKIMNQARIHADAGSLAARPELTQVILMCIALEQEKEIQQLKDRLNEIESKKSQE